MKLPEEKETDMTEQVLLHERENPTLKLQETPQSLRDREKKEKMKDGVRDAEGEGVHSVSSHIRCLDSRPRSFKKNGIEAEKKQHFSLFCVWHRTVVHPLQSSFDVVNKRGAVWMPA